MQSDFRTRLEAAREWEKKLDRWARRRGWYVLPTYDYSGKGDDKSPKLLAPAGEASLVLPDLQCFRDGECRWLECKWKTGADFYRKGGYRVTGMSLRLLRHYQKVQKLTKSCVVVAFLHEQEQEVRGASLDTLGSKRGEGLFSHDYLGPLMGQSGMAFWRYDEIPLWASLESLAEAAA